jgi:hypothetical protein
MWLRWCLLIRVHAITKESGHTRGACSGTALPCYRLQYCILEFSACIIITLSLFAYHADAALLLTKFARGA